MHHNCSGLYCLILKRMLNETCRNTAIWQFILIDMPQLRELLGSRQTRPDIAFVDTSEESIKQRHNSPGLMIKIFRPLQRSAKVGAPGLVNYIIVVAYHFCPSLAAAFMQPGASTLADLCTVPYKTY